MGITTITTITGIGESGYCFQISKNDINRKNLISKVFDKSKLTLPSNKEDALHNVASRGYDFWKKKLENNGTPEKWLETLFLIRSFAQNNNLEIEQLMEIFKANKLTNELDITNQSNKELKKFVESVAYLSVNESKWFNVNFTRSFSKIMCLAFYANSDDSGFVVKSGTSGVKMDMSLEKVIDFAVKRGLSKNLGNLFHILKEDGYVKKYLSEIKTSIYRNVLGIKIHPEVSFIREVGDIKHDDKFYSGNKFYQD